MQICVHLVMHGAQIVSANAEVAVQVKGAGRIKCVEYFNALFSPVIN